MKAIVRQIAENYEAFLKKKEPVRMADYLGRDHVLVETRASKAGSMPGPKGKE